MVSKPFGTVLYTQSMTKFWNNAGLPIIINYKMIKTMCLLQIAVKRREVKNQGEKERYKASECRVPKNSKKR